MQRCFGQQDTCISRTMPKPQQRKTRGEDLHLKTLQMLKTLTIKGPLLFSRYLFWKKI